MTRPAGSRSLIRADTLMDSEPLMTPESIVKQKQHCFDLGCRSIEATVLAGRISAAPGIRVSMADLSQAPAAGNTDRQLDQMADARK